MATIDQVIDEELGRANPRGVEKSDVLAQLRTEVEGHVELWRGIAQTAGAKGHGTKSTEPQVGRSEYEIVHGDDGKPADWVDTLSAQIKEAGGTRESVQGRAILHDAGASPGTQDHLPSPMEKGVRGMVRRIIDGTEVK